MLSKKTKYAIKALIHLAKNFEKGNPILISEISKQENIPKKFLEAILVELKNAAEGIIWQKNPQK
jgi:DNA-binding IscR family transcriptional regulator